MKLTDKQIRNLKGLAHHIKPVVMIGQNGLTDGVLAEMDVALEAHELIKVKVAANDREERKFMQVKMAEETGATLVQSIGHVAVFYRRHPHKPKISLKG
ncbi:MAG: ribosome assembly RNA-binding protein YhbY [Gammaproteobacteria bacterium]|nr:ribosome assembly RNA-binding protein YhbY [Gammaproteobacteria bacterium]